MSELFKSTQSHPVGSADLRFADLQKVAGELSAWYQTPYGCYVQRWLTQRLDSFLDSCFGAVALQYGVAPFNYLSLNRMPHQVGLNTGGLWGVPFANSDADCWPFAPQSLDLIVMPHVLEYEKEPYALMRECVDMLSPEGFLLLIHLNPRAFWRSQQKASWVRQTFSSTALFKDLRVLGLQLIESRFGCYCPPKLLCEGDYQKKSWMDHAGDRWFGHFGGVYYLLAQKKVFCPKKVGRLVFSKHRTQWKPVLAKEQEACLSEEI